jgi:hypothetical protein
MKGLRYTLVSDGSSDRALLPILSWLLKEHGVRCPIQAEWADLRWLRNPPKVLASRIERSLDLYPGDLLFVHRDAENQSYSQRKVEIEAALAVINPNIIPSVCVVPVRMLEAWLIFNEGALRRSAGNPHGQITLELPDPSSLEQHPDPKSLLYQLLKDASELRGRRLKNFDVRQSASRVTEYIQDFAPLRILTAFQSLENDLQKIITQNQWATPPGD